MCRRKKSQCPAAPSLWSDPHHQSTLLGNLLPNRALAVAQRAPRSMTMTAWVLRAGNDASERRNCQGVQLTSDCDPLQLPQVSGTSAPKRSNRVEGS